MSLLDGARHILRTLTRGRNVDDETREELAFHLDRQTEKYVARGLPRAEAARRAAIDLGGFQRTREEISDSRAGALFRDVLADLKYARRTLAERPGFTLAATLTLAIGIGASTAVFAITDAALVRPLPFPDAGRLVSAVLRMPQERGMLVDMIWSYPKYEYLRDHQRVFSSLALHSPETVVVSSAGGSERMPAEMATSQYFAMLGATPVMGRTFTVDEDRADGQDPVVIISDGLWRTGFGGREDIIGQTLILGRTSHRIIGVLPPGFHGLSGDATLWVTLYDARGPGLQAASNHNLELVGRVATGITPTIARLEVERLGREIDSQYPSDGGHWGASLHTLDDLRVNPAIRRSIQLLGVAVLMLLAFEFANLAALFVTRNASRRQELAIRAALGAGRRRLVRQLAAESLTLSACALALGIVAAIVAVRVLASTLPISAPTLATGTDLTRLTFSSVTIGWSAVGFAIGVAMAIGGGVGLMTAVRSTGGVAFTQLRQGSASSRANGFWSSLPVVVQIAFAAVFLVGSGMTIESLARALAIPLEYQPRGVVTAKLTLDPARTSADSNNMLWGAVLANVRALPGVETAAVGTCLPIGMHCDGTSIAPAGHAVAAHAMYLQASADYFAAIGTRVIRGREFTAAEVARGDNVAIINAAAARTIWGADDPLRTPIQYGKQTVRIVGIVGDARYGDIEHAASPAVFFPYRGSRGVLLIRARGSLDRLAPALRDAIHRASPGNAVAGISTMDELVRDATARNRLSAQVFTVLAISALLLVAIGVYSALALRVTQRTRELAVRRALGATPGSIVRLVGSNVMVAATAGGVIGVGGAWAVARTLSSLLYDVRSVEPPVYVVAATLLLASILSAGLIPTVRSIRIDPREAMRAE